MNAQNQLFERLIKLYPISLIKDFFHLKGSFDDMVPEIIKNNTQKSIFAFASTHINYTHQHVHIYRIKPKYNGSMPDLSKFPLAVKDSKLSSGELNIYCFPEIEFEVLVTNPILETTLSFYQPIRIRVFGNYLIIQVTTLEKNLSHFFKGDRKVVDSVKNNGDDVWIPKIVNWFATHCKLNITICDLHKGVKKIWDDNVIDPKYAKSKYQKSTNTVAMDEQFTVRQVYPDVYDEMVKNPLLKTLFKYKKDDEVFTDHFSVDPMNGKIIFSSFSNNVDQIENVINEILKHN